VIKNHLVTLVYSLAEKGGVMFGYFLLALVVSVFFGFFFFLIVGQPSGVGVSALVILLVGGAIWHINRNKKKK
jgi:hypothetical protein